MTTPEGARRSRRVRSAATALLCALLTGALGMAAAPATSGAAVAAAAEDGTDDWTMMIYDVADNNIAEIMVRNLAQFPAIPNMDNVNIVALVDLPEKDEPYYPRATIPGIAPFTTAKLMVLQDGKWNEIRDQGEVAMGRPDTLANFIEEAAGRFPADKYGLVLSDHGGAYGGGYVDEGAPGTSQLRVPDLRDGIATGMQRAGIDQFEVIDHDSCLMASYEATSALAPLTRWLVASEEITFGDTTLSNRAMELLGQDVSGEEWGIANNEDYAAYADSDPYGDGGGAFTALSVVDTAQAARLDHAVDNFVDVVVPQMDQLAPTLAQARSKALGFVAGLQNGDDLGFNVVDLGDFMRQLGDDLPPEVAVARDAVFAALDAAVTAQVTRQATQQATGLNVFFPKTAESAQYYLDNEWGTPSWHRLVEAYLGFVQSSGGGEPAGGGGDGVAQFLNEQADVLDLGPSGIRISGQLAPGDVEDVADVQTQVFARFDGQDTLVSVLPATLNSGGEGQVQGSWNFAVTALASGDARAPVSALYQAQSGGIVGAFYASYSAPDGYTTDVMFRVLLDSSGQIQSFSAVDMADGGGAGPIDLEEGGTLTPYLLTVSNGSGDFVLSSRSVPSGADVTVRYPKLPAGTPFEMGLVVTDVSGGTTIAGVSETTQ